MAQDTAAGGGLLGASIDASELETDAVESAKIKALAVTPAKISYESMELVGDTTLASPAASVTYTSMAGEFFLICICTQSQGALGSGILMYLNADEVATNYYNQYLEGEGANVAAGRANSAILGSFNNAGDSIIICTLSRGPGGEGLACAQDVSGGGAAVRLNERGWFTAGDLGAEISTIKIVTNADNMDTGTEIQVWRKVR